MQPTPEQLATVKRFAIALDEEERSRHDLSTLRMVIHTAAPCPPSVKREMIDWLGPVIEESYGSTENNGSTYISSEEWLQRPGSVGRARTGTIHIVSDDGEELPPREVGNIYFSDGLRFEYYGDPEKTARAYDDRGWSTIGDIGYVDEDGYLYLTDRKDYTIISGGVNVYPKESEDALVAHPAVFEAAVIGVPNEEFGEEVKAIVVLGDGVVAGASLERELIEHCRAAIAHLKCPRSIDFVEELPYSPTGKVDKKKLREPYWRGHSTRIV